MGDFRPDFESSYERLRQLAYRPAYRLLGDPSAAQDVADEAVVRAFVRWETVRDYPEAWVVKAATNLALDVGRRRAREAKARWQLIDGSPPNEQIETRLDLQSALRDLPKRQREVVTLRYLGDFSVQDTARALGLDEGTVKSHASRGLSRLRAHVERV